MGNIKKIRQPFLGAAYYPEAWDECEQERDIAMMKKAGISVVRIAEFAWSKMEPEEGKYNFDWLHRVIERLAEADIAVILGTPTATPPIWLEEKDPSMMVLKDNGMRATHGGRRNNCSNNPTYREYSARITEKMAMEFGTNPNVIGWQLDNEIYTYGSGCYCEHCKKGFAEYLQNKYGTIENFNLRLNLNLFSQEYKSFEQVPMPLPFVWHGPHLRYEWLEFMGQSHIDFIKMQSEILHRYTKAPIGTDMMSGAYGVDYERIAEISDIMQFNHYDDEENLFNAAFWFDYLRPFKNIPFWCTETSTCWNGGTAAPKNLRPEGFCTANSWLPVILGGGANMYWLWRQHWAGHELMHGAVLYSSGRPMHMFGEVQKVAEGFENAADFLDNTKVVADAAMISSCKSSLLLETQHIAIDNDGKWDKKPLMHKYISDSGIRPDVISPKKDLSPYKLLFTPYLVTLEEANLAERIEKWVRDGGVWVAGPITDLRHDIGTHYTDRETGILERLVGCDLVQQIPDNNHSIRCEWNDGSEYKACHFLQLFDVKGDAQVLVKVTDGFTSLIGKTLVLLKKVGKGTVIVIGALPEAEDAARIMAIAADESGIKPLKFDGNVVAARREGNGYIGIAAQEITGSKAEIYFDGCMTDLLTGMQYTESASIEPFGTVILSR